MKVWMLKGNRDDEFPFILFDRPESAYACFEQMHPGEASSQGYVASANLFKDYFSTVKDYVAMGGDGDE